MPPKRKNMTSEIAEHADEDQAAAVEPPYVEEVQDYEENDEPVYQQPAALPEKNDALSRARHIAAKLGPLASAQPQPHAFRESPVVIPSDSPPYEPADERTPSPAPVVEALPLRTRDRRSASPDRHGPPQSRGYKRGRSTSRERQQQHPSSRGRRDNGPWGGRPGDGPDMPGGAPAVEFRVPAELVGLIIGRQGSNLKAVEQRHGVRVATAQDYDRRDPERTISIMGPLENAENARAEILDFVARNSERSQGRPGFRRPPPGQSSGGGPPPGMSPQSPGFGFDRAPPPPGGVAAAAAGGGGMVMVSVPSAKVGLIIGRGGESIREIQRVSGARVQVEPDDGSGAPERVVKVSGAPEQIESARARIMEIVSPERSMRDPAFGGRGPPQHHHHHQQQQPPYGGGPGGPPQQPMYGGPPGMPEQHSEEMQVPAESVGLIIGRGGESIKMIQQTSGARVNIIQDQDRSAPFRPQRQSDGGYGGGRPGHYASGPGQGSGAGRGPPQQQQQRQMSYGRPSGGYGGPQQYHSQQQQQQQSYQNSGNPTSPGGYAPYGGYAGSEQMPQPQQPQQQQQYGQGAASAGATGEQTFQWTNQQTADYYAQYASTSPEYAQYAEYYRKLAEKDPHGIVPSSS
ncbi:hypothetical protein GGI15_003847 [Coemansia interrupta]|uniref:K Homology domain-containing protein n=1 Tax=Coemansia interrupta TaxID=1126814 RepID=A0A9W8HDP0_9FUNG|nr:hypothetical protein GGI15_003847 [Coemansia interrupta]